MKLTPKQSIKLLILSLVAVAVIAASVNLQYDTTTRLSTPTNLNFRARNVDVYQVFTNYGDSHLDGAVYLHDNNVTNRFLWTAEDYSVRGGILGAGLSFDGTTLTASGTGSSFPAYIVTTGETSLSNVLNAAIARMIIVSNGTYTVDGDWKVTNTATVKFMPGAIFSIDSGKTLNIRGNIDAQPQQIFTGSGVVTFSNNFNTLVIHPEWWGAKADFTVDSSAAWQKCMTAAGTRTAADLDFTGSGLSGNQQAHIRAHNYPLITIRPASGSIFRMTNTVTIQQHYFGLIDFNGSWFYCEGNGSTNGAFYFRDCREMRVKDGFFTCFQENPVYSIIKLRNVIGTNPDITPTHMLFENLQAYGNLGGMKFFVYAEATNASNNEFHMFTHCGAHDYSRGFALIPESQMKNWIFVNCSLAADFRMKSYGISTWDPELAPNGSGSFNVINCQGGNHYIADFMATAIEPMTIQGCNIENSRRFLANRFTWVETNSYSWATNGTSFFLTNTTIAAWCLGTNVAITNAGFTFEYPASKDIWEYLTATNTIVRITNNSGQRPYNPTTGGGTLFSIVQVGASGITNVIETGGHQQYVSLVSAPMLVTGLDWSGSANESWDGHGVLWGQIGPLTFKDSRFFHKTKQFIFDIYGGTSIGMDSGSVSFEGVTFKSLVGGIPLQAEAKVFINRGDNSQSTNGIDTGLVRITSSGTILCDGNNSPSNVVDVVSSDVFRSVLSAVDTTPPFQVLTTNLLRYWVNPTGAVYTPTLYTINSNTPSLVIGATNHAAAAPALKNTGGTLEVRAADDSGYKGITAGSIRSELGTTTAFIAGNNAGGYYVNGRWQLSGPADGVLLIRNDGGSDFGRIQFGGTTAAFPAIAKTNAHLAIVDGTRAVSTNMLIFGNTIDTTASTGMTVNRQTGRVRLSSGQQTYLLTNNLATANSIVTATVNTDDATALNVKAIPSAGLITLKCNAATTANTDISFFISSP